MNFSYDNYLSICITSFSIGYHFSRINDSLIETTRHLPIIRYVQIFIDTPTNMFAKINKNEVMVAAKNISRWKCNFLEDCKIFIHAPYNINLSNIQQSHKNGMKTQCRLAKEIGANGVVIHMGKSKDNDIKQSKELFINRIIDIASDDNRVSEDCPIIIETCVGAGSELFSTPREINKMFKRFVKANVDDKIGLCVDTAHIWGAGYLPLEFINELDDMVVAHIKLIHLNDSKVEMGSNVDVHQTPFCGKIPKYQLYQFTDWAIENNIPIIIE